MKKEEEVSQEEGQVIPVEPTERELFTATLLLQGLSEEDAELLTDIKYPLEKALPNPSVRAGVNPCVVGMASNPGFFGIRDKLSGDYLLSPGGRPIITRNIERAKELARLWFRGVGKEASEHEARKARRIEGNIASFNPEVLDA